MNTEPMIRRLIRAIVRWALRETDPPLPEQEREIVLPATHIMQPNGAEDVATSAPKSEATGLIPIDESGVSDPDSLHRLWRAGMIPRSVVKNVRGRTVRAVSVADLDRVTTVIRSEDGHTLRCKGELVSDAIDALSPTRCVRFECLWCARLMTGSGMIFHAYRCAREFKKSPEVALGDMMASKHWAHLANSAPMLKRLETLSAPLMTPSQIGSELGVSEDVIYHRMDAGLIPYTSDGTSSARLALLDDAKAAMSEMPTAKRHRRKDIKRMMLERVSAAPDRLQVIQRK